MFQKTSIATYSVFGLQIQPTTWTWSWTLSRDGSILFHIALFVLYATTVEALRLWMKIRSQTGKPYKPSPFVESLVQYHNISLSVLSLLMGCGMLKHLIQQGRFNSWHSMSCINTFNSGSYGLWNLVYLASKIWEWLDTYFLILQGREGKAFCALASILLSALALF